MNIKHLSQYLRSAAVVSVVSAIGLACTSGLREYTQIDLQIVDMPDASQGSDTEDKEPSNTDPLAKAQTALEKRLSSLDITTAEVGVTEPDQVVVRLPQAANAEAVASELLKLGQLTLQLQKPDTEEQLSENIETLQRLLIDQNTLAQADKQPEAAALQPQIDETRSAILSLFEPGSIDSTMVTNAQAIEVSGFNIWEVRVWLNSQGKEALIEQSKAIAGTGRSLGIFLDDILLSAPTVDIQYAETGLPGSEIVIAGNFTAEAARDIERQLKNGKLPVELDLINIATFDELTSK